MNRADVEKLFTSKVLPGIAGEKKVLEKIRSSRSDTTRQISELEEKAAGSRAALAQEEAQAEEAVLAGANPGGFIKKAELYRVEVKACENKIKRLQQADTEAAQRETEALMSLSAAIKREVLLVRSEIEAKVKPQVEDAIRSMAGHEVLSVELYRDNAIDPAPEDLWDLGRFRSLAGLSEVLAPFVEPIGARESYDHRWGLTPGVERFRQ